MTIQTLAKKKNKKEKKKSQHTPKTLQDMKLKIGQYESQTKIYNAAMNWMRRYIIERKYEFADFNQAKKAAKEVTFGRIKMRIQKIENMNESDRNYYNRLLKSFEKEGKKYWVEDFEKEKFPVKITVSDGKSKKVGYSVMNGVMTTHEKKWRLENQGYDYETIWDYQRLLTKVWLDNLLYEYLEKNIEQYQEKVVKQMLNHQLTRDSHLMPTDSLFQRDYLQIAKNMVPADRHWMAHESLNHFKTEFYFENGMNYHLRDKLIQPFLLDNRLMEFVKKIPKENKVAKVYETNQNILPETMDVMKDNEFLTHYGFVELHNSVDLKAFQTSQDDFKELKEKINIPVCKDYSFRVKKLGNHNAGGAFYRRKKTIIVDVENPHAFVHELGHQINIVKKGEEEEMAATNEKFVKIEEEYKKLVEEKVSNLPSAHHFYKGWNKPSGYNRHYYFDREEIFARCFEMYVDELGIKNSLLKLEMEDYIYPKEIEFRKEIKEYFDELLNN